MAARTKIIIALLGLYAAYSTVAAYRAFAAQNGGALLGEIGFALFFGVLPALLWLWFWLHEDKKRPEPRGMIALTFLGGMAMVPLVIPFEQGAELLFGKTGLTIIVWAGIEEVFKFGAAYVIALRSRFFDEPIDGLIYLITAALGFAAFENVFFLFFGPVGAGELLAGILTGNLRFVGATLLHTVASAVVGGALAISFFKHRVAKRAYVWGGLILATALHALFNFSIMQSRGFEIFIVFEGVWGAVVLLVLFFEKIKRIRLERMGAFRKKLKR